MAVRSLTEAFMLMRNNALQSKHFFSNHNVCISVYAGFLTTLVLGNVCFTTRYNLPTLGKSSTSITHQLIVLKSCSNSQKTLQVLVCNKKKFLVLGFFVGDIISGIGLGIFGRGHQVLGPNCKRKVFCSSV